MPGERSLLERLREPEPDSPRTIRDNPGRMVDSILANLRRLLNSRQGIAPIRPDYGLPDLCDLVHDFPEAIDSVRKTIKTAIEKFEPRLRRVSVLHVPVPEEPLELRFEITAELVTERERVPVWIETRIDGSGAVQVQGKS